MNKTDYKNMLYIGIASFFFYIFYAWALPITDPVESNYALTAKEMLLNGSYISPMIFGHTWYDKPPLTYWFLMLSFKIFGFNDFAARLPAALTATTSIVAMYASVIRLFKNRKLALYTTAIMATTFEFWYISRAVITDGYLFLGSLGVFVFSYLALAENRKKYIRLAYVAAGIAVLAKGPVGIVLPGFILILYMLCRRRKSDLGIVFDPLGILLFFVVASPWYIAMADLHGKDFILGFLGLHNVARATVSEHPTVNVWYYYLLLTPLALMPWLGLTIYEIKHNIKNNSFKQFSLIWTATIFIFYTLVATKYITYTFIGFIPLFIINAQGLMRLMESTRSKLFKYVTTVLPIIIFLIILGTLAVINPYIDNIFAGISAAICVIILLLGYKFLAQTNYFRVVFALAVLIFLGVPSVVKPLMEARSAKVLVNLVEPYQPDEVYFYGDYGTSYSFYTGVAPTYILRIPFKNLDIWDQGKAVMPHIDADVFGKEYNPKKRILIIVKRSADFAKVLTNMNLQKNSNFKVVDDKSDKRYYLITNY